jgi:hypothetical protein
LSVATAFVINSDSIKEGVVAEDDWLQEHYPGFQRCPGHATRAAAGTEEEEIVHFAHHTDIVDGRIISVLCVVLPSGEEREFYFDVTAGHDAQREAGRQNSVTP